MGRAELVRIDDAEFFVEVSDGGGPQTVGLNRALSFDGVRDTIRAVATQLHQAWQTVRPDEATVEFGLSLTAKTGKLTGLIVEGDGAASLRITMTWRSSTPIGTVPADGE
jgi:hypothetical protein